MKNYDYLFILICLFIFRIIMLSATYADSICLTALFAYKLGSSYLESKKTSDKNVEAIQVLSNELADTKNSLSGIKAAVNFVSKR